jgi:hypothetical protein
MHKDTYTLKKNMSYTNIESHENKSTTENKEKSPECFEKDSISYIHR